MAGIDHGPARVSDPYLTAQGVGEGTGTWAPAGPPAQQGRGEAWERWATFAGVVMLMAGMAHVLLGVVALFDASWFDPAESDPALRIGYSAWGWLHVAGGVFLLAAGGAVMARKEWGRIAAIVVAAVSAVGALAFLPTAPVWGLVLIAFDVVIIHALTVHRADPA
jgi:hypothetical protein